MNLALGHRDSADSEIASIAQPRADQAGGGRGAAGGGGGWMGWEEGREETLRARFSVFGDWENRADFTTPSRLPLAVKTSILGALGLRMILILSIWLS